jgi:hypothetical protein
MQTRRFVSPSFIGNPNRDRECIMTCSSPLQPYVRAHEKALAQHGADVVAYEKTKGTPVSSHV